MPTTSLRPTARPPEVLCLGETMVLVTPVEPRPLAEGELFRLAVGGAESNVALSLANLGHRTSWASRLGDDPLGQRVLTALTKGGVDTSHVVRDAIRPTGVYFKDPGLARTAVHYYRKDSAAACMSPADLARLPLDDFALLHVSGVTAALSASCRELLESLLDRDRPAGTRLSFDVNYRPALWRTDEAAPVLLDLARRADVVFVGLDEARTLWGTDSPAEVRKLIDTADTLVVKDEAVGATEYACDGERFVPSLEVNVVEPVGAGDAFAAGYLSGMLQDRCARDRLRLGHALAAWALSSTSDFVPLRDTGTLDRLLALDESSWCRERVVPLPEG